MTIGKRAKLSELDEKGWTAFAADAGLGLPLVRRRVAEMSERAIARANVVAADLVRPGLDDRALLQFAEMVVDRAERCAHSTRGNGVSNSREQSR
jgi:serine/threonine-protein kinase HipA